jgi:hypothetical protein
LWLAVGDFEIGMLVRLFKGIRIRKMGFVRICQNVRMFT